MALRTAFFTLIFCERFNIKKIIQNDLFGGISHKILLNIVCRYNSRILILQKVVNTMKQQYANEKLSKYDISTWTYSKQY